MQLVLLALYAAFYPTLLAAVVVILSQPRRLPLLAAYLAGGLTISIGLGLAIVSSLKTSHSFSSSSALSWGADLALGGLALLVSVALATRADERARARRRARHPEKAKKVKEKADGREPWSERILARGSTPIVFAAGLAVNVPGAAYLVALKDIAAGHHSTGVDVFQILVFNVIMFTLAEVPLLGLIFAPERTDALVARMNAWLSSHSRQLAIVISALFGTFLIARGIAHS